MSLIVNPPEFIFFQGTEGRHEFLRLTDANDWLIVPGDNPVPQLHGNNDSLPEDPFEAIDAYFRQKNRGIIGGWITYDFMRLNPKYDLSFDHSLDYPLALLAHYPDADRTDYISSQSGRTARLSQFRPTIDRSSFLQSIQNIKDLIRRGYVYQINFSQRFEAMIDGTLKSLFAAIPSTMIPSQTVLARWNDLEILSLSPERLMGRDGRTIRTLPIKGTRPRDSDEIGDERMKSDLRASRKDAAEHLMIVDLERNDLNRICKPGSVHVPSLMDLESFPTVHHLVSTVEGRLRPSISFGDIFRCIFPGGSITGCPKPIAVRMIDQLEDRYRGIYTGTLGYWDCERGLADWNIAIRTLVRQGKRATWDSGGGIVIDSDAADEYDESLDKVELIRLIRDRIDSPNTSPTKVTRQ